MVCYELKNCPRISKNLSRLGSRMAEGVRLNASGSQYSYNLNVGYTIQIADFLSLVFKWLI